MTELPKAVLQEIVNQLEFKIPITVGTGVAWAYVSQPNRLTFIVRLYLNHDNLTITRATTNIQVELADPELIPKLQNALNQIIAK